MEQVVLLASFTLLRLPEFRGGWFTHLAVLVPFWVVVAKHHVLGPLLSATGRQDWHRGAALIARRPIAFLFLWLFWLLAVVAQIRALMSGSLALAEAVVNSATVTTILAFAITLWAFRAHRLDHAALVGSVFASLGIYLGLSVVMTFAGIQVEELLMFGRPDARMLTWLGFNRERTRLAFGAGLNAAGLVGGALLQASLILLVRNRARTVQRYAWIAVAALGALVMLLTDSRAAMMLSLVIGAFGVIAAMPLLTLLKWSVPATPALPIVLLIGTSLIANTSIAAIAERGSGDLATGNGRFIIWGSIVTHLMSFGLEQMWGYGHYGHVASGVVFEYKSFFPPTYLPEWVTAHNGILQIALDTGYVGVVVILALVFAALSRAQRSFVRPESVVAGRVLTCTLTFLLLSGMTEASPTLYNKEAFVLFLFCAVAALVPDIRDMPQGGQVMPRFRNRRGQAAPERQPL